MNPLESLLVQHQNKLRWAFFSSAVLLQSPVAAQLWAWFALITI